MKEEIPTLRPSDRITRTTEYINPLKGLILSKHSPQRKAHGAFWNIPDNVHISMRCVHSYPVGLAPASSEEQETLDQHLQYRKRASQLEPQERFTI